MLLLDFTAVFDDAELLKLEMENWGQDCYQSQEIHLS